MEELFELQQKLISTQDEFKQAILSEVDAVKHPSLINSFSKLEKDNFDAIQKLQQKLDKEKEDKEDNVVVTLVLPQLDSRDAKYFADKYSLAKIKAVAKSIGVKVSGTELQVATNILNKISADEFEKLIKI